jgi:hypothetical protein
MIVADNPTQGWHKQQGKAAVEEHIDLVSPVRIQHDSKSMPHASFVGGYRRIAHGVIAAYEA